MSDLWIQRKTRQAFRGALFIALISSACLDLLWLMARNRFQLRPRQQAAYVQKWSRLLLRGLGIALQIHGEVPQHGIIVCNHLSYLDILVLGSACPMLFVAKSEVQSWPVLGALAKGSGNIFIRRNLKMDLLRVEKEIARIIEDDVPVVFFPEGTSSDGSRVLPFKSSLFIAATRDQSWVTPARLAYSLEAGSAGEEMCYWGEMTFLPHLIHLFSLNGMSAKLHFGAGQVAGPDRKRLAKALFFEILRLGGTTSSPEHPAWLAARDRDFALAQKVL